MAVVEGRVMLCKAKTTEDKGERGYAMTLESAGFTCVHLPVLRFEFLNLQELRAFLLEPRSHSGLILTSPRSVEAVGLALGDVETEVAEFAASWSDLPVYCVGPATEQLARKHIGLRSCCGSEAGNAQELAKLIISEVQNENAKPFLYPCSIIARDSLASTLGSAGIALRKLQVYQTMPSETLQSDLDESFSDSLPEFLVLFSPSGVKHVVHVLKVNMKENLLGRIKIVAIGPVTSQAVAEAGLEVYATSEKPDPEALLRAINILSS